MPPRRRRDEAPRRRWPIIALFVLGVSGGRGAVGLFAQPAGRDADRALCQRPLEVHRCRRRARPCARAGRSRRHPRRADPRLDGLAAHVGGLGARAFRQGAADLGRPAGARPHRRLAARRVHDRGLCRLRRGAGRHAEPRPLRAGRPFDGRRGGLDLCRDAARSRQPAHPGRCRGLSAHHGDAPLPTRLARLPVVGDIGIYFKPERLVRRSLSRGLCRSGDGDARARQALRRAAALPGQPRGDAAARPHPGAARSRRRSSGSTCRR